jgi:hypothetical protein
MHANKRKEGRKRRKNSILMTMVKVESWRWFLAALQEMLSRKMKKPWRMNMEQKTTDHRCNLKAITCLDLCGWYEIELKTY